MFNINVSTFTRPVVQQRRFRYLLIGLVSAALLLGLIVVPIEKRYENAKIKTWEDGIWWSVITVTGVGYGDIVPVSTTGRILGMALAAVGVMAYGLIISMFSWSLEETRDRYYRLKMFEQLDDISARLDRLEKGETYLLKKQMHKEE